MNDLVFSWSAASRAAAEGGPPFLSCCLPPDFFPPFLAIPSGWGLRRAREGCARARPDDSERPSHGWTRRKSRSVAQTHMPPRAAIALFSLSLARAAPPHSVPSLPAWRAARPDESSPSLDEVKVLLNRNQGFCCRSVGSKPRVATSSFLTCLCLAERAYLVSPLRPA
eukprot:scaffold172908_cov33-Tisochrysis_lutea.AAC.4